MKVTKKNKIYSFILVFILIITTIVFTGCSDSSDTENYLGLKIAYLDNDENLNNVVKDEIENFSTETLIRIVGTYGLGVNNAIYNGYQTEYEIKPANSDKFLEIETLYQTNLDAIRGDIYSESLITNSTELILDNNYYRWNWSNFNKTITKFRLWDYLSVAEIEAERENYLNDYLNTYQKLFVLNIYEILLNKEITTSESIEKQFTYLYTLEAQNYINQLIYGENGIYFNYIKAYDHLGFNSYECKLIKDFILNNVIGENLVKIDNSKKDSLTYNKYYFKNYISSIEVLISGYNSSLDFDRNETSVIDKRTKQEFLNLVNIGACSESYNKFNALSAIKYADVSLKSVDYNDEYTSIESYRNFLNTFGKRVRIKSIIPITSQSVEFNGIWFNINSIGSGEDRNYLDKEFKLNEKISDVTYSFNYYNGESISKPLIEEDDVYFTSLKKELIYDKELDSINETTIFTNEEIQLSKFINVCEAPSRITDNIEKANGVYNCIIFDEITNKYIRKNLNDCYYIIKENDNSTQTETMFNYKKAESSYIEFTINLSYDLPIQFGFVSFY